MVDERPGQRSLRRDSARLLVALGLIIAAWVVIALGQERVSRLDLSRWGNDIDIPEALAIDEYRSTHFLPYVRVAVIMDFAALAVLRWPGNRRSATTFEALVTLIWFVSSALHGLNWLVTSFFAK